MSEKKAPEWSATFQRLRAETTVLALLFFAFTHVSVSLEKVPLIGVDIDGGAPKGVLLIFIFSFWLYFALSWFLRYRADRKYELLDEDGIRQFLQQLEDVPRKTSSWRLEGIDAHVQNLNETVKEGRQTNYDVPSPMVLAETVAQISLSSSGVDFPEVAEHRKVWRGGTFWTNRR